MIPFMEKRNIDGLSTYYTDFYYTYEERYYIHCMTYQVQYNRVVNLHNNMSVCEGSHLSALFEFGSLST